MNNRKTSFFNTLLFLLFLIGGFSSTSIQAQTSDPKLNSNNSTQKPNITPQNPADTTYIEIINAEQFEHTIIKDEQVRKLTGYVQLQQKADEMTLWCDSAYYYLDKEVVEAQSRVHFKQGDSLDIYSDYLFFDDNKKTARLEGNVHLADSKSDIYSDYLFYDLKTRKAILNDNVHLTDEKSDVYADSLEYFVTTKMSYLYKDVTIEDDKVKVRADKVEYSVNTRQSTLIGNVNLNDGTMDLSADRMEYDMNKEEGTYSGNGKLLNNETTLTSEKGRYFGKKDQVIFEENVHLVSPNYEITSSQLDYNIQTESAKFNQATTITQEDGTIQTDSGEYNAKDDQLQLFSRSTIVKENNEITANDFFYDKKTGIGNAKGDVLWVDTVRNLNIKSDYANFYDDDERVIAYDNVLLSNVMEEDTLYITADTLTTYKQITNIAATDSTAAKSDTAQILYAYHNVKMLKSDLQGVCDSLTYSLKDSVFRMFQNPVLWVDEFQLSADTIRLTTQNNKPHTIDLIKSAFIGNRLEDGIYNQIAGRNIYGFFKDSNLDLLKANGNAQNIYFGQNEEKEFLGINQATSSKIWIFFAEKAVSRIKFIGKSDAKFTPIQKANLPDFVLPGFAWYGDRRPKILSDLVVIKEIDATENTEATNTAERMIMNSLKK
ncbi:MAG: OstA-like protein [Chitinophagales bacterium]